MIALQGNGIDRADTAGRNGKGWSDGGMYTLNTIDRHTVCYAIDHVITSGGNCTAEGPCIYENVCPTEKAGGVHAVMYPVEAIGHDERSTRFAEGGVCDSLMANDYKQPIVVAYPIENHPADSRVNIDESGTIQTLTSRMGTGGGNVPMILEVFRQTGFADYERGIGTLRASGGDIGGVLKPW